ncbi:mediator of RNA polymerase II transcription subunit 15-like [Drosophila willistoni]|nr:mediator of RNA polymerase II transcription subunit 15-like [Drosophila willistoni]
MSANVQHQQILATQQQHQSAGQQHQPTAQASQQQASSSAVSKQQKAESPLPQTAAKNQLLQQMMAQQQHKLAAQQHQPAARTSQLRIMSPTDTQQLQPATPAPQFTASMLYSQQFVAQQQQQLVIQRHQPAAQAAQPLASSSADTQQQQSSTPAPPVAANSQQSQILATQQQQQLMSQQQHPDQHLMERSAHFDGAPSLIRFECHLRYQKFIENNELKRQKEEKLKLNKPVERMEGHVINGLFRDFKNGTRNRAYIEERLKGQPIQIQRLVLPPLRPGETITYTEDQQLSKNLERIENELLNEIDNSTDAEKNEIETLPPMKVQKTANFFTHFQPDEFKEIPMQRLKGLGPPAHSQPTPGLASRQSIWTHRPNDACANSTLRSKGFGPPATSCSPPNKPPDEQMLLQRRVPADSPLRCHSTGEHAPILEQNGT